jgi:hypothetical protein
MSQVAIIPRNDISLQDAIWRIKPSIDLRALRLYRVTSLTAADRTCGLVSFLNLFPAAGEAFILVDRGVPNDFPFPSEMHRPKKPAYFYGLEGYLSRRCKGI